MIEGKAPEEYLGEQLLYATRRAPADLGAARRIVEALVNARKVVNDVQKKQMGLRIKELETKWGTLRPGVPVVLPVIPLATYPTYKKWDDVFLKFLHEVAKTLMLEGECAYSPLVPQALAKSGLIYRMAPSMVSVIRWLTDTKVAVRISKGRYVPGPLCKEFAEGMWSELGVKTPAK